MVNTGVDDKIRTAGKICEAITKTLEQFDADDADAILTAMVERTATVAASLADVDDERLSVTLRDNLSRLLMTQVRTECQRMERLARGLKGGK